MALKPLAPGAWMLPLGFVNAFLLEGSVGLVLIDTSVAGSAEKILAVARASWAGCRATSATSW
jgi:hypothetical protein